MLEFHLAARQGDSQRIGFNIATLIVAGWTGRDEAALRHHIEELAAIGVPRPSSVPVFYRNATLNVTQTSRLQVLGPDTSGEAEPVGIALSKQLCGKPVGGELWLLDDVVGHWDQIKLRAFATIDGRRVAYQDGTLAGMRTPADLISRWGKPLSSGTVMFCGTLAAIGGIRPASRFEVELEDPVLGRTLRHAYDIDALPVVS